jgi:hypothetical protein
VCLAVIVHGAAGAGCSYQAPDGRASDPGSSAQLPPWLSAGEASRRGPVRDFQEMMKAKYGHQQCGEDSDCPLGTHCDDETGVCDYECTGDDGCHSGQRCSDGGECVYGFTRFIASTDTSCASIPAATQLATLAHIAAHDNQGQISCFDDTWCPCGSFCDTAEMECAVECSALPGSTIACTDSTATCDPSGHCVTPSNPAPTPQLALVMSPASVSGDTFSTSVDVNVAVSVDALDVAFVVPTHPATVTYQVLGADTATGPEPLIKCTPSGTFASSCEIDGGWTFDTTSGSIHSATQTIVVRLPQTTVPQTWTLQASSEWAAVPTTLSADAAPVTPPPSVAGRYTGSLTVTSSVGPAISVPVDAVVTDTSIALVDRSTTVLPDGHADFSRDAAKVTMVRWLSSTVGGTTSGYNAAIKLGALIQDPKTGRITIGPGSLTLGAGAPSGVSLVLDRVGDLEPAACVTNSDCPVRDPNHPENDQYCDLVVGRCVLGDAPASGPGIVDATSSSATPSATLPSVAVAAWRPSVQALRQNNAALAGTGVDGVVRAYCARNPLDSAPPSFNADGVLSPAAQDAQCTPAGGGPDYPETMFPFAEQKQEFAPGVGGSSNFVLQDVCNTELNETPSSAIPGNKQCVSPARFFAALQANVDPATGTVAAGSDSHQYLVSQILRQWVGLQTYLVSTAAKSKDMHDLFEDDTLSAQARLAQAADLFEQELGVLLDPSVRPQFATGSIAARIAQQPDYRLLARATSRWNFNDSTIGDVNPTATVPDTEGNNGLVLTYSPSTNNGGMQGKNGYLSSWGYGGTRTCQTSGPIALDNNNWSFSAAVTVWTFRSASAVTLFDKVSSSGKRITLTAAPTNPDPNWPTLTPTILLQLKDSDGGSVDFTVPSWLPANFYSMSLIAVVSEQGTYRRSGSTRRTSRTVVRAGTTRAP